MLLQKIPSQVLRSNIIRKFCRQVNEPIQVTLAGAASDIGANVSLLLKQNPYISRLNLYDDDPRVLGYGIELSRIPGNCVIACYAGHPQISKAVSDSNLILMVTRIPRKVGHVRNAMLALNSPPVFRLCTAMAHCNPNAFLAISTNPVNALIPLVTSILQKNNAYNPNKVFGITQIDACRSRAVLSTTLNLSPYSFNVPVIGGHSCETILPLFSNTSPGTFEISEDQIDFMTHHVQSAGTDVLAKKNGVDSSTIAMAYSIEEFTSKIIDAIRGCNVLVHAFVANPHYGTRYFAGPTHVNASGIYKFGHGFPMSQYEENLLKRALPNINRDVDLGIGYYRVIQNL